MTIGVLTFWEAYDNYGQMMQCWALQKILKTLGHDPYVIQYKLSSCPQKKYSKFNLKRIAQRLHLIFLNPRTKIISREDSLKSRKFDNFRRDRLRFSTRKYYSLEDLQKNPPIADAYIAGSDQIWGYKINEFESKVFFLAFGSKNTLRVAYAPSFGMSKYPQELKNDLKEKLSHFNSISVRESCGVKICESVGYSAKHVLDPTLLLSKSYYEELLEENNRKEKYLFVYSINISTAEDIRWTEIKSYAQSNNLSIVATASSGYTPALKILKGADYDNSTIEGWLNNIANANLVITTSFHGIAFSIIFHKQFIYVPLKGKHSRGNNRVEELLDFLDLTSHILDDKRSMEEITNQDIDWYKIDALLKEKQNDSLNYLIHALEK